VALKVGFKAGELWLGRDEGPGPAPSPAMRYNLLPATHKVSMILRVEGRRIFVVPAADAAVFISWYYKASYGMTTLIRSILDPPFEDGCTLRTVHSKLLYSKLLSN
jgi:hypothetical protein